MKKLEQRRFFMYFILSILTMASIASCINKSNKENQSLLDIIDNSIDRKVDAQILTDVVESNLKIVAVSKLVQEKEIDNQSIAICKSIENDHIKLKNKIKKIAQENLIIIPDTLYEEETITLVENENTNRDYVYLTELENLLKEEVEKYKMISNETENVDLKIFSIQSMVVLDKNLNKIEQKLKK